MGADFMSPETGGDMFKGQTLEHTVLKVNTKIFRNIVVYSAFWIWDNIWF